MLVGFSMGTGEVTRYLGKYGSERVQKGVGCRGWEMIGTQQQNISINGHEATQKINMRYKNRFLLMSLAIAGLALGGCPALADGSDQEANQDITVTCTSTVAYDVGACQILANARCKGTKAQLRGVLSSTLLPPNKLYQNVARYRCLSA
jgi:hypothetical protein